MSTDTNVVSADRELRIEIDVKKSEVAPGLWEAKAKLYMEWQPFAIETAHSMEDAIAGLLSSIGRVQRNWEHAVDVKTYTDLVGGNLKAAGEVPSEF